MTSYRYIFLLFLLFSTSLYSQFSLKYGVRAGLAFSNQDWKYTGSLKLEFQNLQSITVRAFADYSVLPVLAVQSEVGYTNRGFRDRIPATSEILPDGNGEVLDLKNALSYIHLALPVKLTLPVSLVSVYVLAGPQYFFMLSNNTDSGFRIVTDEFKNNSFGYTAGAGIELSQLLPVTLTAEYRYEADLDKIYKREFLSITNYTHSIMLGVRF